MRTRISSLSFILLFAVGCAVGLSTPARSPEPVAPAGETNQKEPPENFLDESTELYRLNVGDLIEIKSSEDPSLNEQVRIGPDGMISYALVGYVRAAGSTLQQMQDTLTILLRRVIREPKVTIFVREYASLVVYVGGEVKSPKEVRITGIMNPLAAVFAAGGFTDGANRNRVSLIRRGFGGKAERFTLDLDERSDSEMELKGFDVLVVPPTAIAQADLYVEQYINRIIPNRLSAGFSYVMGKQTLQ